MDDVTSSTAQPSKFGFTKNLSGNLFQQTNNDQSYLDFGGTASFIQRQQVQPIFGQTSVQSTSEVQNPLQQSQQLQQSSDQSNNPTAQTVQSQME